MDINQVMATILIILSSFLLMNHLIFNDDTKLEKNAISDMVYEISPALVSTLGKEDEDPLSVVGSGFIIDPTGLILTNAHVVAANPGAKVKIQLAEGEICEGLVDVVDYFVDLATIKIDCLSPPMPIMKLGDSDKLKAGEFVVALGSPLGLSNTVTTGVCSNPNRSTADLGIAYGEPMQLIETDASLTYTSKV